MTPNHRPSRRPALLAAVLALALALSGGASRALAADAPLDLTLPDMTGKKVALKDLLAHGPVLVNFWATWCGPCVKELPHLQAIHQEFAPQGLTVVAISEDNSRSVSKVRTFIEGNRYGFTVLLDTNGEAKRRFKSLGTPYTVLFDRDGKKAYSHIGYKPGDEKDLHRQVAALMTSGAAEAKPADEAAGK